jgi:hypothetical protein
VPQVAERSDGTPVGLVTAVPERSAGGRDSAGVPHCALQAMSWLAGAGGCRPCAAIASAGLASGGAISGLTAATRAGRTARSSSWRRWPGPSARPDDARDITEPSAGGQAPTTTLILDASAFQPGAGTVGRTDDSAAAGSSAVQNIYGTGGRIISGAAGDRRARTCTASRRPRLVPARSSGTRTGVSTRVPGP